MLELREDGEGILLKVRVIPRSSRNKIAGEYKGGIKVKIAAPPVESKANEACIRFLAEEWNISRKDLAVVSGVKSRDKVIHIYGLSKEEVRQRIKVR